MDSGLLTISINVLYDNDDTISKTIRKILLLRLPEMAFESLNRRTFCTVSCASLPLLDLIQHTRVRIKVTPSIHHDLWAHRRCDMQPDGSEHELLLQDFTSSFYPSMLKLKLTFLQFAHFIANITLNSQWKLNYHDHLFV